MDDKLTFSSGFKDVLPTMFGYIGVGLAFGVVAKTDNLSIMVVFFMSFIVYAGSAQFLITQMLAVGSPITAIVVSTALINSRMGLMSMTVAPYLRKESTSKNILLGSLLTDETFALSMNKMNYTKRKLNFSWLSSANLFAYLIWGIATVVGAVLGSAVPNAKVLGLDFAVVAMFIGLLYLQMITDRTKPLVRHIEIAVFVAVVLFVLMRFISGNTAILIATLLGCVFGMVVERK